MNDNPGSYYQRKEREAHLLRADIKTLRAQIRSLEDQIKQLEKKLERAEYLGD